MKTMLDAFDEEWAKKISEINELEMDYKMDSEFKFIEISVPMNIALRAGITIVDIETTGIDANRNKIVTVGIVFNSYLTVLQRANCTNEEFLDVIAKFIDDKRKFGFCQNYAYNCSFEKRFLSVAKAIDIERDDFYEIMPYRISKDNCVSFDHFGFGVGKDVPKLWKKWEKTKELDYLHDIMKHNTNCLLKELAVFMVNYSNYDAPDDDFVEQTMALVEEDKETEVALSKDGENNHDWHLDN